jgi:hypothetical protein
MSVCVLGLVLAACGVRAEEKTEKIGTLSENTDTSDASIAAMLFVKDGGGELKLAATGELAAKLKELVQKSAYVTVAGVVSDGTMQVETVTETERPPVVQVPGGSNVNQGKPREKKPKAEGKKK